MPCALACIPYLPQDISEPREQVGTIRARLHGKLLNLDRMLLHSPPFAQGFQFCFAPVNQQRKQISATDPHGQGGDVTPEL
ncbi:MAG: hypothetical protein IMY82_08515 [Chloroflexi bacterium]|nr:hypothetical protein [Chloroflexota bacterium]